MIEVCSHCKGAAFSQGIEEKELCEFCGGLGVNSWLGNMLGRPDDGKSVRDIIDSIVRDYTFSIIDDEMIKSFNEKAEEALKETHVKIIFHSYEKSDHKLLLTLLKRSDL